MSNTENKTMEEKSTVNIFCFQTNKVMLRFKVHFFLYIGAMGTVLTFLPVIAQSKIGISATALATIVVSLKLLTIITKPGIGYIVDYFNKLKLVMVSLIIIQAVFLFLVLIIPPIRQFPHTKASMEVEDRNIFNNQNSEILTLVLKSRIHCENIYENESFVEVRNETVSICVQQYNKTALICFQECEGDSPSRNILQEGLKSCCVITSKNKSNNETFNYESRNIYFRISPIQEDISLGETDKSFLCLPETIHNNSMEQSEFRTPEYWMLTVVFIVIGTCTGSVFPLSDTSCFERIQKQGGDFGRQRIYGAISWGAFGPIAGLLCDYTKDFLAAWILMTILLLLALWNICELDFSKPHFPKNILKDVAGVVKSREFVVFELGVFMNGMGDGIVMVYLAWFLTSLGGSKLLCGLAQYVQCFAGEIPFMFFSTFLLKKVGYMNLISLALMSYAVRFTWYSYSQNPWYVLPVEIVHGFTYGSFYPAVVSFGKLNSKPGTEATMQSILFTTHDAIGAGVGCVISGLAIDYFGVHQTFTYLGIFFFCAVLLNIFNTILTRKKN